ncbi:hypothetical protein [Streptomyces sp. NRRL F-4474]|uniref:hypothetical protein n=1 Tax=Streptomyces sp. NRRL F-4474 TaxID=1463851 RepID=UPI0004C532F2
MQVRRLLRDHRGPQQRRRRTQSAQAQPRRVAGGPRDLPALVPQVPVRVALHQPQAEPDRDLRDRGPSGRRQGATLSSPQGMGTTRAPADPKRTG